MSAPDLTDSEPNSLSYLLSLIPVTVILDTVKCNNESQKCKTELTWFAYIKLLTICIYKGRLLHITLENKAGGSRKKKMKKNNFTEIKS